MTEKKSLAAQRGDGGSQTLNKVRKARTELEAALAQQAAELERLEHALVEVAERESERFGQQLHDTLSQQLLGAGILRRGFGQ
jgi:signal transduction histidine kinase